MDNNEVRVWRVKSWHEYTDIVRKIDQKQVSDGYAYADGFIFRGHADPNYKLSSRLERNLVDQYNENGNIVSKSAKGVSQGLYEKLCSEILSRFKSNLEQIPYHTKLNDDNEIWALGRHHGLLTPFLDWTYSPYVSAFFSFYDIYRKMELSSWAMRDIKKILAKERGKYVVVWKLNVWKDTFIENEFEQICLDSKIGTRINAQQGLFTNLKTTLYDDVESYLKSRNLGHYLERIEIPIELTLEVLHALDLMGIHIFRLFPDYIGAAEQANIARYDLSNLYYLNQNKGVGIQYLGTGDTRFR